MIPHTVYLNFPRTKPSSSVLLSWSFRGLDAKLHLGVQSEDPTNSRILCPLSLNYCGQVLSCFLHVNLFLDPHSAICNQELNSFQNPHGRDLESDSVLLS